MASSRLQRERKKKGAFEPLEQEAMLNILRANDQFQNRFGRLKAGLVSRHRCEQDRRVVYVEITARALKLLQQMDKPVVDLHHQWIGHLARTELKNLIRWLEKTRAPLSAATVAG